MASRARIKKIMEDLPNKRLMISYTKKTTGKTVRREVRPYEVRGDTLWASDTVHGAGKIHEFKLRNIHSIVGTNRGYRPVWPVKVPR